MCYAFETNFAQSISVSVGKKPLKPSKPQALAGKKPSKLALEGNKWLVVSLVVPIGANVPDHFIQKEYYENETLTIDQTEISQSVNVYGCKNTIVIIKGKVNAVNIRMYSRSFIYLLQI